MMVALERVLILGCGVSRWLRSGPGVFGVSERVGSFGAHTALSSDGTRHAQSTAMPPAGEATVSISGLLDRQSCWLPSDDFAGTPKLSLLPSQGAGAPKVPSLVGLSRAFGSWAAVELGGPGVMVVPASWASDRARSVLHGFSQVGWRFSTLEQCTALQQEPRVLSQDGIFARYVQDGERDLVFPVDAHAARALSTLGGIYKQLLSAAGPQVSAHWLEREEDQQGWFARTQILLRVTEGLREGREEIDLGGPQAPIFGHSASSELQELAPLHALRVRVRFPAADTSGWLKKVAWPGFLRSRSGKIRVRGLDWGGERVRLLGQSEAPFQQALEQAGVLVQSMPLDQLFGGLGTVQSFQERSPGYVPAAQRRAVVRSGPEIIGPEIIGPEVGEAPKPVVVQPEPEPEVQIQTPAPKLTRPFHAQRFELSTPHRADSLRVFVDGQALPDVVLDRLGGGAGIYQIEGLDIPHGALLRVDFEPTGAK